MNTSTYRPETEDMAVPVVSAARRWWGLALVLFALIVAGAMLADLTFDSEDDALDNQSMPAAG